MTLSVAFSAVLLWCEAPDAWPETFELGPGRPAERFIRSGEVHVYSLAGSVPPPRRLVVEQRGIDVVAVEIARDGERLAELNDPLGRFDREVFFLDGRVGSLEIRPLAGGVASGSYRVTVETRDRPPSADPGLRGLLRTTEAAALRYGGSSSEMQRAAELYEEAAADFAAAGDRRFEARALLSAANFRRRLEEAARAYELYEAARKAWGEIGEQGFVADSLVGLGQCARRLGRPDAARALLEEALPLWHELGRGPEKASTLASLGLLAHIRGEFQAALELYREALEEQRRAGQRREVANLLLNIGGVHHQLGDAGPALENERRSLEIFRQLGDHHGEMDALNNLAGLYRRMGEPEAALSLYGEVLELASGLGDRAAEARALNNRGFTYRGLGEVERASGDLERSLALRREAGDRRGELVCLTNLGDVEFDRGDLGTARRYLEAALELARERQDRNEIGLLGRLGRLLARSGDPAARALFEEARGLLEGRVSPVDEAELLYRESDALLHLGDAEGARRAAGAALALWTRIGDETGQAMAATALGRAVSALGLPGEARRFLEDAVELLESVRTELASPDLRAAFLAERWEAHGLLIDVLMELHAADPGVGHDRAALGVAQRVRARRLLDLLAEADVDLERRAAPELASRRRDLLRRLSLLARRQRLIELGRQRLSPNEDLESAIADLRAELDVAEAEIRRRNPRRQDVTPSSALAADALRKLLEPGTSLVWYALGERRSHLWVVSSSEIESFVLAPRRVLEQAARRFHEALATLDPSTQGEREAAAAALADLVLRPAAAALSAERLAVVADGALNYVPFAALPLGGGDGLLVVDRYETVRLPSATFLANRRRQAGSDPPREASLAILADPVFDPSDPRLAGLARFEAAARTDPKSPSAGDFGRLAGSRLEAEAIARWVAPERRAVTLGFEASRDALNAGLGRSSIVHFATHGVIDTEYPELSGLVLARFGADGQRRADGFLRLHDVYGLDLDAELVVLSGCRTALGRELRGEGFVGLTSGFFYAGARRVMASLWPVADRATAELMGRFYRGLLAEGLAPAAALRRAQLALAGDRRFRDPYYWAAFVLQGDWR